MPLRLLLVIPFVAQIFAAVGLTGWLSLGNSQKAVTDLATKLSREATTRIEEQVRNFTDVPHLFLQMNLAAIQAEKLDLEDFPSVERYFWHQIQLNDWLSILHYGNKEGNFIYVKKAEQDVVHIRDQSTASLRKIYRLDGEGNRAELIKTDNFDPRTRPWYKAVEKQGKPTWSGIYVFAASSELGITPVVPIYNKNGVFQGGLAIDFTLSQISQFLRRLNISKSGQAFIIERSGDIVASSVSELPFVTDKQGRHRRLKAAKSSNPLIAATAQYLQKRFGSLHRIEGNQQFTFDLNGKREFVQLTPLRDGRGLNWLLVVVIPEADFMETINANTRQTILLCLAALLLATAMGILTARLITRSLLRLSEASKAIAKRAASADFATGEFNQTVTAQGIEELVVLAESFNGMAAQLRESFTALEEANEELEQRVEQRTAQLRAANQEITILNERLKAENLRMSAELEVTRRLQEMLLPKADELESITGLDIAGFMKPADEVGGDYYDVLQHNDQVKISIGDVTGHGLESGVLTIMVQTAVRTLLASEQMDSKKFLEVINRTIYDNVQRMNSDKNLSLSLLDYQSGQLRLSGQHEEMIIVRCGGRIERIDTIDLGFPIGLEEDITSFVDEIKVQLNPEDVVVLYTDGITEAENVDRVQYGIERLCEVVRRNCQHSASAIKQAVIDDLQHHIGEQKVYDDITLVVIKQK